MTLLYNLHRTQFQYNEADYRNVSSDHHQQFINKFQHIIANTIYSIKRTDNISKFVSFEICSCC